MVIEAGMRCAYLLEIDVEVWADAVLETAKQHLAAAHSLLELLLLIYHLYTVLILLGLRSIANSSKVAVHSHD